MTLRRLYSSLIHNAIVHPWLPLAEWLESKGVPHFPQWVYNLHDRTVPEER